ncbi:hypothetical protein D7V88_11030 [Corallococcus terminator]|uniref:Uncharacterized protein n=1 Tax=Corallococcus terminator TaxID=2316733 RepID=A0A3A8J472_9BACT|nr:hypothetical protein D7V88_11030 [Corallococcus terminator]
MDIHIAVHVHVVHIHVAVHVHVPVAVHVHVPVAVHVGVHAGPRGVVHRAGFGAPGEDPERGDECEGLEALEGAHG